MSTSTKEAATLEARRIEVMAQILDSISEQVGLGNRTSAETLAKTYAYLAGGVVDTSPSAAEFQLPQKIR